MGLREQALGWRHRCRTIIIVLRVCGFIGTLRAVLARMAGQKSCWVRAKPVDHKVLVRMNNCDLPLLGGVFATDECSVDLQWQPRTIVDLGANIGLTVIKFRKQFPHARMIAVEADPGSASILESNLEGLRNCVVLRKAIGYITKAVVCTNPTAPAISRTFVSCSEGTPGAVQAVPVESVLELESCESPVLLKMDIEGAEEECFLHAEKWLSRVDGVLVESHSAKIEELIVDRLNEFGFRVMKVGEKIFGERRTSL